MKTGDNKKDKNDLSRKMRQIKAFMYVSIIMAYFMSFFCVILSSDVKNLDFGSFFLGLVFLINAVISYFRLRKRKALGSDSGKSH